MNTKILMTISALTMGVSGLIASFLPQELLNSFQASSQGIGPLLVQLLGSFYLAFAMVNWMSKANLIGGIYNRPIAMGNLLHFSISALTIIKAVLNYQSSKALWIAAILYSVFAVCFAIVFFSHPIKDKGE